jgi:tetratricopeptide (TPR) repeat protein
VNNLGALHQLLGQPEEQLRLYQEAVRIDPHYVDALHNIGDWHLRRQDWARAHESFQRALAEDPSYSRSLSLDALALFRMGRGQEGISHLERAVAREPRDARLRAALGGIQDEMGNVAAACEQYRASLALAADQPDVQQRVAALCRTP